MANFLCRSSSQGRIFESDGLPIMPFSTRCWMLSTSSAATIWAVSARSRESSTRISPPRCRWARRELQSASSIVSAISSLLGNICNSFYFMSSTNFKPLRAPRFLSRDAHKVHAFLPSAPVGHALELFVRTAHADGNDHFSPIQMKLVGGKYRRIVQNTSDLPRIDIQPGGNRHFC